ncbi:MAG: hypothetical protein R2733_12280 [Acidimicrobiales bacterium]
MTTIGFLHTSPVHVSTFETLVAEADASMETMAVVDEALLADARRDGLDDHALHLAVRRAVADLAARGAGVVVCTCSTIGSVAEHAGELQGVEVFRVDRPMAEEAVRLASAGAGRIGVVTALESTVGPTHDLLESVAAEQSAPVEIEMVLSDGAWAQFEAGDVDGYLDTIAATCADCAEGLDVIVLAQASMADAVGRYSGPVPVLASPQLAVTTALARLATPPPTEPPATLES